MITSLLKDHILVLDGAMGTMIQTYGLTEADFRGERFAHLPGTLKGNNDVLVLTRPDVIRAIHDAYLEAGADIIETNSFNATSISQADYHLADAVSEINFEAARLARMAADDYTRRTPDQPRFVAGSVGPTNKTASLSPDVSDPGYRAVTFDDLVAAYTVQMAALIRGGVDLLLIETVFDTLNAKAALFAARRAMEQEGRRVPLMLSVTVADSGGRTLSGQTLDALLASVSHADLLSIGLNCSFGARDLRPFVEELARKVPCYVSVHPNAGLPNQFGAYDETPESMAVQMRWFAEQGFVNIVGGCCGTTPAHIRAIREACVGLPPHVPATREAATVISGLERLAITPEVNFVNVGERCNVAGSRKFLRLIKEKNYDEALTIAREQIEAGAQVIDINMDDGMLDTRSEMITFLNLIASEPEICRVPVMIDSSRWEVIEAGLKCVQGKSIVNSISLKEGETPFLEHARKIRELGAAVVVMAFDEEGQADTYERRVHICERAYHLLVDKAGFNPYDIIFDPNILAIATGIPAHDNYAVDFIRTTAWIKANLPGAKVSGGVSNLSFALRGNNYIREAMHAVFLYHAIRAGMDMGIVNPASSVVYEDIPADLLEVIEDVVLNRRPDATERLIAAAHELAEAAAAAKAGSAPAPEKVAQQSAPKSVAERLIEALRRGNADHLEADLAEALHEYPSPLAIISGPLMEGMDLVGRLFGEGKMFLPQIVKTARTMKRAVEILRPHIEASQHSSEEGVAKAGRVLLATVKGDVHDIGKNIVGVILGCNNFEVIDLGVMAPADEIVRQAIAHHVDIVGLSGLITPSLEEMARVAIALEEAGLSIPIFVGGATTSAIHTAVKIAPHYSGPVFHLRDAARNPLLATQLLNPAERDGVIARLREEQARLRAEAGIAEPQLSDEEALAKRFQPDWSAYAVPVPHITDIETLSIPVSAVRPFINWIYFLRAWRLEGFAGVADIDGCDHCRAAWLASVPEANRPKAAEAMQLIKEANRLIESLEQCDFRLRARVGIFPAVATADAIQLTTADGTVAIPTPRAHRVDADGRCKSLCDFVMPAAVCSQNGKKDYVGAFVATVGEELMALVHEAQAEGDDYRALLLQSVGDRLAEAASEWLHREVRTKLWGYAASEALSPAEVKKGHYRGIRPAVGYPSLPDQHLAFTVDRLLAFDQIGVGLTCNGAMTPPASVCGLYFAHPESRYFMV